jgi:hypothetical protein
MVSVKNSTWRKKVQSRMVSVEQLINQHTPQTLFITKVVSNYNNVPCTILLELYKNCTPIIFHQIIIGWQMVSTKVVSKYQGLPLYHIE